VSINTDAGLAALGMAERAFHQRDELKDALEQAARSLSGIASVNMQSRDDAQKLRDLAEWRLDAKRVLPIILATLKRT
jgi:hypothetical protein